MPRLSAPYQVIDGVVAGAGEMVVVQRRLPGREGSFWYAGEVARCGGYHLVTSGSVALRFNERHNPDGSDKFYDDEARAEALERGLTDRTLRGAVHWYANNWFAVLNDQWATESSESPITWTAGIRLLERIARGQA